MVSAVDSRLSVLGSSSGRVGLASHPGGVEILLVASYYRKPDKLHPDGPIGLNADFTFMFEFS